MKDVEVLSVKKHGQSVLDNIKTPFREHWKGMVSDACFVSLVHRKYNSVSTWNIFIQAKLQWLIRKKKSSDFQNLLILQIMHNNLRLKENNDSIGSGFR